jgi:hypothetical protein
MKIFSMLPNKYQHRTLPNQTKMRIELCQTKPNMSTLSACHQKESASSAAKPNKNENNLWQTKPK